MMTSAQVVETSVTITDNSPSQDYAHPDDQTTLLQHMNCMTDLTIITEEILGVKGLTLPGKSLSFEKCLKLLMKQGEA